MREDIRSLPFVAFGQYTLISLAFIHKHRDGKTGPGLVLLTGELEV